MTKQLSLNHDFLFPTGPDQSVTVSSRTVADKFGKRHDNVLQSIQNLECSEEFSRLNFQAVKYTDAKGESRPEYQITRDGFVFLAMGAAQMASS